METKILYMVHTETCHNHGMKVGRDPAETLNRTAEGKTEAKYLSFVLILSTGQDLELSACSSENRAAHI